jgi:CubicO group peptidase (beta-lactamase class C family)
MRVDTLLPWFSCTKAVTAVAVLQQWERGRLHLDDRVVVHVPEFDGGGKGDITVRHLLTHTAGIRNAVSQRDNRRFTWEENVAAICAAPLDDGWRPGWRAGYHAVTAFHLLGEIVRRADGRPFADYVSEEVLEPLDMGDAWLSLPPERFRAYGDRVGRMHAADGTVVRGLDADDSFERTLPSGSGIGPMGDLVKLYEALLAGGEREGERVLRRETVEALTARHRVGMRDETFGMVIDWGLGVMVNSWHYRRRATSYGYGDHASMRAYGHGGSQSSLAFADPDAGLAVALCCNAMPGEAANHRRTQPVITALYEELGLAT